MTERRFMPGGPRGLKGPAEKPRDLKGVLRRLFSLAAGDMGALAAALVLSGVATLSATFAPLVIGQAVAAVSSERPVWGPAVLLLAIYGGDALVRFVQHWLMASAGQNVVRRLRVALFAAMKDLPLAFFDRHTHGELMSRLANDVDAVSMTVSSSLSMLVTQILSLLGVLWAMLSLSVPLTAISLCGSLAVAALVRLIAARSRRLFARQRAALGELNGLVEESVSALSVVRAFGREAALEARFDELNERLREAGTGAQICSGVLMPAANVVSNVCYLVLAVACGLLAVRGSVSIGLVTSFLLYSRQFTRPFVGIANVYNDFQSAVAGLERVFQILDEPPEPPDAPDALPLESARGDVEFCGVTFGYDPARSVLKNVSLKVPAGARVALVGPTGAGKTTLVNLLARFYDATEGSVLLDERDVRAYKRADLRKAFSFVLQEATFTEGTVREAIACGRSDASDEDVLAAARAAEASSLIERLPNGLDTPIGEGGAQLSQGERQLLAIARAICAARPVLVLDEATSSVDTRTEQRIHRAMREAMKGRTAFIIAHRLSTIRDCDLIVVLNQGEIAEQGTHDQLLAENGLYARMYRAQTGE